MTILVGIAVILVVGWLLLDIHPLRLLSHAANLTSVGRGFAGPVVLLAIGVVAWLWLTSGGGPPWWVDVLAVLMVAGVAALLATPRGRAIGAQIIWMLHAVPRWLLIVTAGLIAAALCSTGHL